MDGTSLVTLLYSFPSHIKKDLSLSLSRANLQKRHSSLYPKPSVARASSRSFIINNCCSPSLLSHRRRRRRRAVSSAAPLRIITRTHLSRCDPVSLLALLMKFSPARRLLSRPFRSYPFSPLLLSISVSSPVTAVLVLRCDFNGDLLSLSRHLAILLSLYTLRYVHPRKKTSGRVKLVLSLRRVREMTFSEGVIF